MDLLENRAREKNVGTRLRHTLRSVANDLGSTEERLGESDALDEEIERTSRAFTERVRGNGRSRREREAPED